MPRPSTPAESAAPVVDACPEVAFAAGEFEAAVEDVKRAQDGATAYAREGRRLRAWKALEDAVFAVKEVRGRREWHRMPDGTLYGLQKTSKCGWGLVRRGTNTKGEATMTNHPDLFAALAAKFDASEVKTRPQGGRNIPYITARTVMNRLDAVLGPESWWDSYAPNENSVQCALTIRLPDGSVLTKCDAGGYAGMADQGDDDKSGYSDAFKRAAVKFGVGRYLYRDGVPAFVREHAPAAEPGDPPAGKGDAYEGDIPDDRPREPAPARPASNGGNGRNYDGPPRSGKALFAWTKEQEQRYSVGLLKYLNGWAKLQDLPGRMVDWDNDQVALAYAEAVRKLKSVQSQQPDSDYEEALSN